MTGRLLPIIFLPAVCVWLAGCGKDPVQVESPEATGDKKLKNPVQVESPEATGDKMKSTDAQPAGKGFLPGTFAKTFEIPAGDKDVYGNLIHKGTDEKAGLPKEIRHKATGIHLVLIAPGSFQMGSNIADREKPAHKVTITKPFYLGKYEVTQAEWLKAMNSKPWENKKYAGRVTTASVNYVSWNQCQEFLVKLNQSSGLKSGMRFALPTEAQWEYACRAETTTKYYFGDDASKLGDYAWFNKNAFEVNEKYAHPVGKKKPNAFGLYDMHGNVWEWCQDWYGDYQSTSAIDPSGPTGGKRRVMRGGSWYDSPFGCRSAGRLGFFPVMRSGDIGFRVSVRDF